MQKKLANNRKGFTLMELMLVVGILAVVVALALPSYTHQMEKAREATDLANIRSDYAEVACEVMLGNTDETRTVNLTQKKDYWESGSTAEDALKALGQVSGSPTAKGTCVVSWDKASNKPVFTFDGEPSPGTDPPVGSDKRKVIMNNAANYLPTVISSAIESGHESDVKKSFNKGHQTTATLKTFWSTYEGDDIDVIELHLNETNLDKYGPYWEKGKCYTWRQALTDAGMISSELENSMFTQPCAVVYFNDEYEPICVSYYTDEDKSAYRYYYLDDNTTYELKWMPANRQFGGYDREYVEFLGGVVVTD